VDDVHGNTDVLVESMFHCQFLHSNPPRTGLGLNKSLQCDIPATYLLSHDTAEVALCVTHITFGCSKAIAVGGVNSRGTDHAEGNNMQPLSGCTRHGLQNM
jgi:hypothetical protein